MNAGETPTRAEGAARMDRLDADARRDLVVAAAWPLVVVVAVLAVVGALTVAAGWRP